MTSQFERLARRYMLQHAHPMKFAAEVLGMIWSVYFLWHRQWIAAVIVAVASFLVSTILLWRTKQVTRLESTLLGKIMLAYSSPAAFCLYNFSAVPFVYGLWMHRPVFILIAISLLVVPHLWSWRTPSHS
jgi:hypothetical protein